MRNEASSFTYSQAPVREITLRVIVLSFFLTLILAASNCFLALKIGYLTSASIPAAILSIGILRFFKNTSLLENNLVQTCASAGEAIAGGIAYTAPALVIIHYWFGFDYLKTFLLALTSGVLGILFSTPLRRFLVTEKNLTFPEGRAVAEILKTSEQNQLGLKDILLGAGGGALLEFMQSGLQLLGNSMHYWFFAGRCLFGFSVGFSATLVGAGYLMGFEIALSLLVGAIIGWGLGIPLLTYLQPLTHIADGNAMQLAQEIWQTKIRYVGIGAMLSGGIWTLIHLLQPSFTGLTMTWRRITQPKLGNTTIPRTERDLPTIYLIGGTVSLLCVLFFVFQYTLNLHLLGLSDSAQVPFLLGCLVYLVVVGFIFSAICGYFSGLVGVSATPGSAIVIGGFLLTAALLNLIPHAQVTKLASYHREAAATIILIGCVIMGIAAIANDNIQDLKTGHLLGATPWKQQIMLLFGTLIAAAIIPWLMQLLFSAYGIGDVLPRPGMDQTRTLAAPVSMMMSTIALHHQFPWEYLLIGVGLTAVFIVINRWLPKHRQLSLLGVAIGIYLPLTTVTPLFVGGFLAWLTQGWLLQQRISDLQTIGSHRAILLACGLVSGAAVMDIFLAIPFAMTQNIDVLRLLAPQASLFLPNLLSLLSWFGLGYWFYSATTRR